MPSKDRLITFNQAIREGLVGTMHKYPEVFVMGLGATDPKGVFETTAGLEEMFGPKRIFDAPVSENALTGIAVGAAISGMRPVMVHQRADFVLMAMDQIVNNAAKWHYMYGGKQKVPLTIRMFVGRGWGQGPQHSQNFQALFAHIPGLKVVCPATPYEAKGLLIASIEDDNPVIFIEHRWLSNQLGNVPEDYYSLPIGKAQVMREGRDVTVVASMDMVPESLHVANKLDGIGVSAEVLNLSSIKPLDGDSILSSVKKTERLLILDSSWRSFGVGAEIAALVVERGIKAKVRRLGLPDSPTPTSIGLSKYYYINEMNICRAIEELLGRSLDTEGLGLRDFVNDVPDEYFKGPF